MHVDIYEVSFTAWAAMIKPNKGLNLRRQKG